jgi:sugar-specific transcriptional regulator TrmB/predicted hydrocarbon binding protein
LPINPERIRKLRDLGLAEYQARVYLALLDLGSATASQIPSISKVPRTRIYVTMAQLHEKGLVNIIPEKPLRYEPIPFSEYLTRRVVELKDDANKMEGNIEQLADEFTVKGDVEPEQRSRFEVIYGRKNLRDKLRETFSAAEENVIFIGTAKSASRHFNMFLSVLEDRKDDKVNFRFVFPVTSETRGNVEEISKLAEVKHSYMNPLIDWAIIDSRDMIIMHPVPDDESSFRGEDVTIWTNDVAMVNTRVIMAREVWEQSADPTKYDPGAIMLNTAVQWLKLKTFKVNKLVVARSIGACMAKMIAGNLKAKNPMEIVEELSGFWRVNELGDITIKKKKPLTIAIENRINCQHRPKKDKPICPFAEHFLSVLLKEKLGEESEVRVSKCIGLGEKKCEFELVIK